MPAKHGMRSGFIGKVAIALAAVAGLSITGCYSNWPPIEGSGQTDPNNIHTRGALAEAGRWAMRTYKPAGPVAFNLPAGLRRSGVLEVIGRIGDGAVPLTAESAASHPVFHLPNLWLRNDRFEVDVVIPTGEGKDGTTYEMTRLWLVGRGASWHVEVARKWETLVRVPELSYLPETEYPAAEEPGKIKPWSESDAAQTKTGD